MQVKGTRVYRKAVATWLPDQGHVARWRKCRAQPGQVAVDAVASADWGSFAPHPLDKLVSGQWPTGIDEQGAEQMPLAWVANVSRLPGYPHLDVPENEKFAVHDSLREGHGSRIKLSSRFSHGRLSTLEPGMWAQPEQYKGDCLAQKQAVATAAVESSIIAAVTQALNVPSVTRTGNLLELGVDSLVGARIVGHLRTELNLDIPLLALFENPVIADLAEEIVTLAEDSA